MDLFEAAVFACTCRKTKTELFENAEDILSVPFHSAQYPRNLFKMADRRFPFLSFILGRISNLIACFEANLALLILQADYYRRRQNIIRLLLLPVSRGKRLLFCRSRCCRRSLCLSSLVLAFSWLPIRAVFFFGQSGYICVFFQSVGLVFVVKLYMLNELALRNYAQKDTSYCDRTSSVDRALDYRAGVRGLDPRAGAALGVGCSGLFLLFLFRNSVNRTHPNKV